jgi:hypothetical protein
MRGCGAVLVLLAAGPAPAQDQTGIPRWIEVLGDPEQGARAQLELLRIGAPAAGSLGRAVVEISDHRQGDAVASAGAARVLIELEAAGLPAFPVLCACIEDRHSADLAADHAAQVLQVQLPFAGPAGREFVDRTSRATPWRPTVARWLMWWTAAVAVDGAGGSFDALIEQLHEGEPETVVAACRVLAARPGRFAHRRERIVRRLVDFLERPALREPVLQHRPDGVLVGVPLSEPAVSRMRTFASLALAAHEPAHELAVLGQCQRLFALDPRVRIEAARALGPLQRPEAGRWLLEALRAGPDEVGLAAVAAIERSAPVMRHLVPELLEFAADQDGVAAQAARRAVRSIAPDLDSMAPIRTRIELVAAGLPKGSADRLAAARARLVAWLDADGERARRLLQDDVRRIETFAEARSTVAEDDPAVIRWLPVRIGPDPFRPGHWVRHDGLLRLGGVSAAPVDSVGPDGERRRTLPFFVVLLPVDPARTSFSGDAVRLHSLEQQLPGAFLWEVPAAQREDSQGMPAGPGGARMVVVDGLVVALECQPRVSRTGAVTQSFVVMDTARDRLAALRALAASSAAGR